MIEKICPLMGTVRIDTGGAVQGLIPCLKDQCTFWVEVYTTENERTVGCSHELLPAMHEGRLRV